MNEKGISSNLWIIDDPFVKGHLLGYIQDHTYEIDYPVIYDGDTLRICDSINRVEVDGLEEQVRPPRGRLAGN